MVEQGSIKPFQAKWPSSFSRLKLFKFLAIDAALLTYAYSIFRANGLAGMFRPWNIILMCIPVGIRVWHRLLNFFLSFPVLPSPFIYYKGGLRQFLPTAAVRSLAESDQMVSTYRNQLMHFVGGTPVTITTTDGVDISGIFFMGRDKGNGTGRLNGPSVIRFNGNGETWELSDPQTIRDYTDEGVNVLLFNYRGVNASQWRPVLGRQYLGELLGRYLTLESEGPILDCEAAIQFVVNHLGVPEERVLLMGHSIGAAFSLQAAAHNHPGICICNSRSFSSLSATVQHHGPDFLGVRRSSALGDTIRTVAKYLVLLTGWELNSAALWGKMRGFKWIEFCKDDHIIPTPIQMYQAVGGSDFGREIELVSERGDNHNRRLSPLEWRQHFSLVESALNLTLNPRS